MRLELASPPSPRALAAAAAGTFDRAVLAALRPGARALHSARGAFEPATLAAVAARYEHLAPPAPAERFFVAPAPIAPTRTLVRRGGAAGPVFDLAWPSAFAPHDRTLRAGYQTAARNGTARARLYAAREGGPARPCVVLLHGYNAGAPALEERVWPLRFWHKLGLDVALLTVPFHAERREHWLGPARFPAFDDLGFTHEAAAQAVHDARALLGYLRAAGAPAVGLAGMSLGAWLAALVATVEPRLAFGLFVTPLASIATMLREQGQLGDERALEAVRAATRAIDPLERPSLLAPSRALVIAGERDAVTPLRHAELLARHLGAGLLAYDGGHLVQHGIGRAYLVAGRTLQRALRTPLEAPRAPAVTSAGVAATTALYG